jgi:DNA mismatch repair protein MutS
LYSYLAYCQQTAVSHLKPAQWYQGEDYLQLDPGTRQNLDLPALYSLLDFTQTSMGGRLLKAWVQQPLLGIEPIRLRQQAVTLLHRRSSLRHELRRLLRGILDLERLTGRISLGRCFPQDLLSLQASLQVIPQIKELLREQDDPWTGRMGEELDPVAEAAGLILEAINPEAPGDLTSGNIIKSGYDPEVDSLRQTAHAGKGWLLEYEEQQKRETGIKSLRVSYNRVFGYYIEVTRPNLALVPAAYQRKQTLANAERFITDELKDWEDRILGARERLKNLEQEIFQAIREKVKGYTTRIQKTSDLLGRLDALQSLAEAAYQYHYTCPEMVPGPLVIQIEGGRHPMVEQALGPNLFVPNDTDLGPGLRMAIITGPNMAGKSTYLRQVALICLLAQVGSFVPAASARLGIARQVFTRIGASDNLAAGQSTFMVEMTEVSHILRHASPQSLVIMDEVGRGTSTYDGLSIAQAVAEYLLEKEQDCPLTLMATHYHQLTQMVENYPLAANYTVAVKEYGNRLVFLYQIIPGASDRSYGIQVARLAGLPEEVLARAASLVRKMELEDKHSTAEKESAVALDTLTGAKEEGAGDRGKGERVLQLLKTVDPQQTTPLEALSILYQLKELADTGSQSGGDQDG